jgi:hypothetical protein
MMLAIVRRHFGEITLEIRRTEFTFLPIAPMCSLAVLLLFLTARSFLTTIALPVDIVRPSDTYRRIRVELKSAS